jgi:hypothetical protein
MLEPVGLVAGGKRNATVVRRAKASAKALIGPMAERKGGKGSV